MSLVGPPMPNCSSSVLTVPRGPAPSPSPRQTLTQPLLLQGPPGSPIHFVSWRTFSFICLGKAWGGGSLAADPSLATVTRTLSWAWGCLCPFVTPYRTPDSAAAKRTLGWEAGNPGFSWDEPLAVGPGRHPSPPVGLLGPVGALTPTS